MHITWSVNSVTHRFGYRNFNTPDKSTNHPVVAFLAWGEGWHNNHHKYPFSAKQGLSRFEFDASWIWIKLLKNLGLVWNVRIPSDEVWRQDHINDQPKTLLAKP